jgi:hypothetical protein
MHSMESPLIRSDKDNKTELERAILIDGIFDSADAIELISGLYQQKLRYHESKIKHSDSEEDIKQREEKIKQLQLQLYVLRNNLHKGVKVQLHAEIAVKAL